jgi:hypothetical protein
MPTCVPTRCAPKTAITFGMRDARQPLPFRHDGLGAAHVTAQQLQRDFALERRIPRPEDVAKRAGAQPFEDEERAPCHAVRRARRAGGRFERRVGQQIAVEPRDLGYRAQRVDRVARVLDGVVARARPVDRRAVGDARRDLCDVVRSASSIRRPSLHLPREPSESAAHGDARRGGAGLPEQDGDLDVLVAELHAAG